MDEPADASDVGSGSEGAVLFAEGADVSDVGVGVDALASLIEELIIADLAGGVDWIGIDEDMITVEDLGSGPDEISFADWNAIAISDEGVSADRVWLYRSQVVIDSTVLPHVDSVDVTEPSIVATKPASTGPPLRLWRGKRGREIVVKGRADTVDEIEATKALNDGETHGLHLPTGDSLAVLIVDVKPDTSVESPDQKPYIITAKEHST